MNDEEDEEIDVEESWLNCPLDNTFEELSILGEEDEEEEDDEEICCVFFSSKSSDSTFIIESLFKPKFGIL